MIPTKKSVTRPGKACCVYGCRNTPYRSNVSLYNFPRQKHEVSRKIQWIEAVRQTMRNKSWLPNPNDRICSAHFAGGAKSTMLQDEAYVPTIFPGLRRGKRPLKIEGATTSDENSSASALMSTSTGQFAEGVLSIRKDGNAESMMTDQTESNCTNPEDPIFPSTEQYTDRDESRAIIRNEFDVDVATSAPDPKKTNNSIDISASTGREKLWKLAGISPETFSPIFNLVKFRTHERATYRKIIKEQDAMLLFLLRIRLGLPFSVLTDAFDLRPFSATKIFIYVLKIFAERTKGCVYWPTEEKNATSENDSSIACVEIAVEPPMKIDERILMWSSGKREFTAKFLIAVAADGTIFKISKMYGGRTTNGFIAKACGFSNFSEDRILDDEKTSVIIEVAKAIERVKANRILSRATIEQLPYLSDVAHACCVLANSQLTTS